MMTVCEVSKISGVSIRALHHYDQIGLLSPTAVSDAGYRLYDEEALAKLQTILLFRELEFPLKDIKEMIESPNFDRKEALDQQICLLTLRKEHVEGLIQLALKLKQEGENKMSFEAFDKQKMEEYAKEAKETWGHTDAYKEYEKKVSNRTEEKQRSLNQQMMDIFAAFGAIRNQQPDSEEAKKLVKQLRDHISENYYECTDEIFASLAEMYCAGGPFTENINKAGGDGTAKFASDAIFATLE